MGAASKAVQLFLHPTEIGPLVRAHVSTMKASKATENEAGCCAMVHWFFSP